MDEGVDRRFSFLTRIKDMDAEIGSGLPEWMDPSSGDGCPLGPEVTGCLLEWEWRACPRDGRSAFALADAIRKLEASARIVIPDTTPSRSSSGPRRHGAAGDPPGNHRAPCARATGRRSSTPPIRDGSRSTRRLPGGGIPRSSRRPAGRTSRRTGRSRSPSSRICSAASRSISAAARRGRRPRAAAPQDCERHGTRARPCSSSHPALRYWRDHMRRLSSPRELAKDRHRARRGGARLCAGASGRGWPWLGRWGRWPGGVPASSHHRSSPSLRDALFADWRSLIAGHTLSGVADGGDPPGSVWVHALVDAARAGVDGAPSFRRAVRQWLDETGRTPARSGSPETRSER